jgi:hypothetical protein
MFNQNYGFSFTKPSFLISAILFFVVLFLYYIFRYSFGNKPIIESVTTSQNITNNAYMTNIDTKLDDLINKIKIVEDKYQLNNNGVLQNVLQFGLIEQNDDPVADPEMYITGDPPNQSIHLKLPKGLKGPLGCRGPLGNIGTPGSKGDLGNRGASGLNIIPSLISNKPLASIE